MVLDALGYILVARGYQRNGDSSQIHVAFDQHYLIDRTIVFDAANGGAVNRMFVSDPLGNAWVSDDDKNRDSATFYRCSHLDCSASVEGFTSPVRPLDQERQLERIRDDFLGRRVSGHV